MLRILYSDSIEALGDALRERLAAERRASDPFAFTQVVVPNANLAKWLRLRAFAPEPSLCLGVEFPFVERRFYDLMCASLPPPRRPQLLPMNAYANGILHILLRDGADADLAPFRRYIAEGREGPLDIASRSSARMAWQLAVKLADLMDQYEVRRREIVHRWLDAPDTAACRDPTERAEAALARRLFGRGGLFPPDGARLSLRQLYERVEAECPVPKGPPQSVFVFGLSSLSAVQVGILHWLARTHDVTVYHFNVCLEYWGDIEDERLDAKIRRLRGGQRERDFNAAGFRDIGGDPADDSTLLKRWGIAGRETLRLLVDLEEANATGPHRVDFEWREIPSATKQSDNQTILQSLQASVRRRTDEIGRVAAQDASVQIVAAPGIRREVEMVYNAVLGAVWKPDGSGERPWSDCSFSDIAVLVTDMKTYRPMIEAVFGARGQVPYSLIDTSASEESQYLAGFAALMAVARQGLSRETVFAVFGNPCVQEALGVTAADVGEWRRVADGSGAFDGFAGAAGFGNVSWSAAMRRARLGLVAKDAPGLAVWDGGDAAELVRGLSEAVELLARELRPLAARRRTAADWARELRRIADEFLSVGRDRPMEESIRRQVFATLRALDAVAGELSLDFVAEAVATFVGGLKCQKGGYLTHGVTIAGLRPMRPVPFKQVFVLGMGEGGFPGRDAASTLDMRGARRTLGDTTATEMNKYLFLETLMATRERLVLSYPCLDIAKDAPLFPSGMVAELKDFIDAAILPPGERFREIPLPLLERGDGAEPNPVGPIVWTAAHDAGILPTYSAVARSIAREEGNEEGIRDWGLGTRGGQVASRPFRAEEKIGASAPSPQSLVPSPSTATAKELAAFLVSPLKAVLRHRLGIATEGSRDETLCPDAPVELPRQGPVRWRFEGGLLDAAPDEDGVGAVYDALSAHGAVPDAANFLGACAKATASGETLSAGLGLAELQAFAERFPATARGDGTDARLVMKPCGAKIVRGRVVQPLWPPKAILEPLLGWLMSLAHRTDDAPRSLCIGLVDVAAGLCAEWTREGVTPRQAREYLTTLNDAYAAFLSRPDADGGYPTAGYAEVVAALDRAKLPQRLPASPDEWARVAGLMADAEEPPRVERSANDLVIRRTAEAFGFGRAGIDSRLGGNRISPRREARPAVAPFPLEALYAFPLACRCREEADG